MQAVFSRGENPHCAWTTNQTIHPHDHDHDHDHAHAHGNSDTTTIALEPVIMQENDVLAARNRAWFSDREILALNLVMAGLKSLKPVRGSLVMVENVGNLVCPALFDLGETAKVAILSVTEGEDKPIKYPHMFQASDLMLLNKTDLLPHKHLLKEPTP